LNSSLDRGVSELRRTIDVLHDGITRGLHLGAQLYVARCSETIADLAIGEIRPGLPMRTDSVNPWLSNIKPVGAVALAMLWERGKLNLDDRVAAHIPEFAVNGKDAITIRHLLTHTAGIRGAIFPREAPWENVLAIVLNARLEPNWIPGHKAGYHPHSTWIVLGELVSRLDDAHRTFEDFVREEIFLPLGMTDSWPALTDEAYDRYAAANRLGCFYSTSKGPPTDPESGRPSKELATARRPSASARGPIRELARFYQMLRGGGTLDAARIISPQTVEALTSRHRVGMFDETFKAKIDWGLGFIIDSKHYGIANLPYGFGPHASSRTFGHGGAESSCAFCDPEHDLIVAWMCNGAPGDAKHQERQHTINGAIYEDLGLAQS
jgi:CubicO group peptidase (beta-lactamase class C family)